MDRILIRNGLIRTIKVHPLDNVAIPVENAPGGSEFAGGLRCREDIPQGHKVSLTNLKKGDAVIRYGVSLGKLRQDAPAGTHIGEHMLELPEAPRLDELPWGNSITVSLPKAPVTVFDGYEVPGSFFAGTRNILGIMSSVQCVTGVLNVAVEKIKTELLPKYPAVDDVVAINHAYGCGVAINTRDAAIPIQTLKNLLHNPNFGGELMVVALGCEMLTLDMLLRPEENISENVIVLQNQQGFHGMIDAILGMAEGKLQKLNRRKRVSLPLERLCIGLQCGGSDAFSGITANPAAGYVSDLLVGAGGTVLFSEVTEVRDGAAFLSARCIDRETSQKLARELGWYDAYLEQGGTDRSANPSPGNKQGGLVNIMEKAMGSIAKSGNAPIVEVLAPGETPTKRGLIFAATPAGDFLCGPLQLAGGITLQVFMTGRGTPYGLAPAPVIKVSSRTTLKNIWQDLIDIDAGTIAVGEETIEETGLRLFNMIIETASGRHKPWAEVYRLCNDLAIFDPTAAT
ncbi:putative galactarate dehydratase (L-threo-forming) [Spirochaetia bacterium]|nr:putative galactarate dehydratase (L-threo-forming) [Spirochaetia bacterium]